MAETFRMSDWNKYAIEQANRARQNPQIERSVADTFVPILTDAVDLARITKDTGHGIQVIFGNDGFLKDPKVRHEVRILRRLLKLKGIEELGFGVDSTDGKSWAVVVRYSDLRHLTQILQAAHGLVFFSGTIMQSHAENLLEALHVSHDDLGPELDDIESPTCDGPTDGNARAKCTISHSVTATDAENAEEQFKELLGTAEIRRINVHDEGGDRYLIEADILCDFDLPMVIGDEPTNADLRTIYKATEAEYAHRFNFSEMNDLNIEVLTDEGTVIDVVKALHERGDLV